MQSIPPALAGLASFPQFITYLLVPSSKRTGKTDKFPVDWKTGEVKNAHDPSIWTTFDNAIEQVRRGVGHGVGFVLTRDDPFFFVDIDGALKDNGEWSDTAKALCAAFPGAAVEVSSSGRGLHILGTGASAVPPDHGCKNGDLNLEFYTHSRFVALTGTQAVGDVNADMGVVLPWLSQWYFPIQERVRNEDGDEWTTHPRAEWRGPVDDAELLRRALQSKSSGAVFGGKASFADLWERNVSVLAVAYPDDEREFDESDADAALASHLAFWTGCNMERMERLMRQSALARSKWDESRPKFETWLGLTVANAVAVQKDVCQDKEVQSPLAPLPTQDGVEIAVVTQRTGATFLHPSQQLELFKGCVYVVDSHRVLIPSGALLRPDQFKAYFGGYVFVMDASNEKVTRNAWEAFTESNVNICPKADTTFFRPLYPPGSITVYEGYRYVNTYFPIETYRAAGDVGPFLSHLRKLIPDERDQTILLSYLAAVLQYKGVKFQWCPLIQGAEGNGKSLLSRCLAYAIGDRYTHWPRADQISKNFNAWQYGKLLICVEDVYLPEDRGEVIEVIKPMITNDKGAIEKKGIDQYTAWICCNWILNSNHDDAIKKHKGDRRFAMFYTMQQDVPGVDWIERDGMGGDYFPKLYDWLKNGGYAAVSEFLHTYAIPDEFNPAKGANRAPITSSTDAAIELSRSGVEQEILEAIAGDELGFMGNWISSLMLNRLLERLGRSRSLTPRRREKLLAGLGYVKHPALTGGRVNNMTLPDAGKPVLFVKEGTEEHRLTAPSDVVRAYARAQGVTEQHAG